jgi:hypothetical protein
MRGGLGGLQEQAGIDPSDWRSIIKILQAGGDPGTETKAASWDTGLGSLDEYQMAELRQKQKDYMGQTINTPDFITAPTKEEMWNEVKDREWGGFFGSGLIGMPAQEDTTREEFEDYYKLLQAGQAGSWQT